MSAFVPHREARWHYAHDAVAHIEAFNCIKGCKRGLGGKGQFIGGTCGVLADVFTKTGEPVPEIDDDGKRLTCLVREPLPWPWGDDTREGTYDGPTPTLMDLLFGGAP